MNVDMKYRLGLNAALTSHVRNRFATGRASFSNTFSTTDLQKRRCRLPRRMVVVVAHSCELICLVLLGYSLSLHLRYDRKPSE
jgi:hypothetical protein